MKIKEISIIKVCFFTIKGERQFEKLKNSFSEINWIPFEKNQNLEEWTKDSFSKGLPVIFICAAGIAVRTIAPFVEDKLTDSPVLVMDENGKFLIPILSGHVGKANEIAIMISKTIGSIPVITTATDINEKFSIDVFAVKNNLRIINREGIKKVSSKILKGEKISFWIEEGIFAEKNFPDSFDFIQSEKMPSKADIVITEKPLPENDLKKCLINLLPKKYCVGIGCKKNKSFEELKDFLEEVLKELEISKDEIISLSSIDLKEKEMGLMELSHFLHVSFCVFSSEELKTQEGDFSESEFVEKMTGVSNVCERSAVLSAGTNSKLILRKRIKDGMTIAIAERENEIDFQEKK